MAKRVAARRLVNPRLAQRRADRSLNAAFVHVVAPTFPRARVDAWPIGHEYILPPPFRFRVAILPSERVWQVHRANTVGAVALEHRFAVGEVAFEGNDQFIGERYHAILGALAVPHKDGAMIEVEILDPQADTLQKPQPGPILETADQPVDALQPAQDAPDLDCSQHHG